VLVAEAVGRLCTLAGVGPVTPVTVRSPGPILPGVFRIDVAATAAVAAATSAVAAVVGLRDGRVPTVQVDGRAAQAVFRSERYLRCDGRDPGDLWAPLSGDYRCADGWIKVHANFDHHGRAAATALGVPPDRARLTAALATVGAEEAEAAIIGAGGVAAAMRSAGAWAAHAQGRVELGTPVVRVRRLGDGPPRPLVARAGGSLAGIRVADLTRVIAGPVCGRVLAGHGADVLAVSAAHLPQIAPLLLDTGFGKRSCHLDLRTAGDRAALDRLLAGADVIVESYRDGALAALGYGADELAARFPGLVVVRVRAYSRPGPWAARRGFDSLVQLVSGLADTARRHAGVDHPVPLPCQALDHATGWLAALGALGALCRRHHEGGSWAVDVSLAATAAWLTSFGTLDTTGSADPGPDELADLLVDTPSPFGSLRHVAMPGTLDGRPPGRPAPPPVPGSSPPQWSPDGSSPPGPPPA
jgi:crotonobetainyl-CoA:carnitine CoA-transferase CaiB-like acyl-CoA transferase